MLQAFSLVRYLKGLCFVVLYLSPGQTGNIVWQTFGFYLWLFVRAFGHHENIAKHCLTSRICLSMFLKSFVKHMFAWWPNWQTLGLTSKTWNVCQTMFVRLARLYNFWMLNWFLQLVFDEFNCVLMNNGQDLHYIKLNWFLECQRFLLFWGTITKISD